MKILLSLFILIFGIVLVGILEYNEWEKKQNCGYNPKEIQCFKY